MKGVQWKVWLGLALLIIGFMTPSATASSHELTTPTEFREEMRRLWEEHILWTRLTIISMVDGLPDAEATTARLLQNEADIGNVIKPFYGNAAGDQLTALLQQHVLVAAELLSAAQAGESASVEAARERWNANADDIAMFLAVVNPEQWPADHVRPMLRAHLELTWAEAVARLDGEWGQDIAAYDEVHLQILDVADTLSTGIINQFPQEFTPGQDLAAGHVTLRAEMRRLWWERAAWTRLYIISALEGLPDADATATRLWRNQTEIGNAIKPEFGGPAGEALSTLLDEHALVAADLLSAAKVGDSAAVDSASARWSANADAIAAFLAETNPAAWPQDHVAPLMAGYLDLTLEEVVNRLERDWEGDVAAYDAVHHHVLEIADTFSAGGGMPAPGVVAEPADLSPAAIVGAAALVGLMLFTVRSGWFMRRVPPFAQPLTRLTLVAQLGLLIFTLGGAVDLLFHVVPPAVAVQLQWLAGHDGHAAHLALFAGMVITLLGIVTGQKPLLATERISK